MDSRQANVLETLPAEITRSVAFELHPRDLATLLCCSRSLRASFDGLADMTFVTRHLRRHYRFIPPTVKGGKPLNDRKIRKLRRLPFMHLPLEYAIAFLTTLEEVSNFSSIVTPLGLPDDHVIRRGDCYGFAPREQFPKEFVDWLTRTIIAALERGLMPLAERPVSWVCYFSAWLDSPDLFRFAMARLFLGQKVEWSRVDDTAAALEDPSFFVEDYDDDDDYFDKLRLSWFLHEALMDSIAEGADSLLQVILQHPLTERKEMIAFTHTALTAACEASKDVGVLRLLLQSGYDVNERDGYEATALMCATSIAQVELLLESGADPLRSDYQGFNALHLFIGCGLGVEAVKLVLDRASKVAGRRAFWDFVNAEAGIGRHIKTPLMMATMKCPLLVQLLLENHACVVWLDPRERTAIDFLFTKRCKRLGDKRLEIARLLFQHLVYDRDDYDWYIHALVAKMWRTKQTDLLDVLMDFGRLREILYDSDHEEEDVVILPDDNTSDEESSNGDGDSDESDEE
ncbi:hypothetical protein HDU96_004466 [Phlyctochytrium bullatum]|nr:hypothetical protein HDU96_004466 [Phlyctochytrium bullatum]